MNMHKVTRRVFYLLRRFRSLFLLIDANDAAVTPSGFSRAAVGVVWIVRFFYLFTAYSIATNLESSGAFMGTDLTDPLWPAVLLRDTVGIGWLNNVSAISISAAVIALLAVVFPGVLIFRVGVFLYLLLFGAIENSYGSINHGIHFYIYISFVLMFLPSSVGRPGEMSRKDAMSSIMVFWFAQSVILLTYSLAGYWKVYNSGVELLAPDGFVRILLARLVSDTMSVPPLLPLGVQQEFPMQVMFVATIYVQLFALFALFRPHLQRLFGVVLIVFHFGTDWLINLYFHQHLVFLGLFLVFSPFVPTRFSISSVIKSLPILGIPLRIWSNFRQASQRVDKAWLIYDGECPLCKNYARYLDVRDAVGDLVLVNAREGGDLVQEVRDLSYDLNEGMVLKVHGRYYAGSDALHMLALMSGRRGLFSVANRILFTSPGTAWMMYPLLKLGRRIALKLRGVSPEIDIDG